VWVDILAGVVHSLDPATMASRSWSLGMPVGALAVCADGGWVTAVERGFAFFDEDWALVRPVVAAPAQAEGTRFNDGGCDPQGRFWAGTLSYDETPGAGALYRLDGAGHVVRVLEDVTISNGIDWSPDGRAMYYVDSGRGTVDRMEFDGASGMPTDRRTLVSIPTEEGVPDGLTVDADGFVWIAMWGGGCVRRYTESGVLDRVVQLHVSQVSILCFGGDVLEVLFITSAFEGLSPRQRAEQPLAGAVFRHRPGVSGLPARRFSGPHSV
jgi:sugar lactone lactonase YvrE